MRYFCSPEELSKSIEFCISLLERQELDSRKINEKLMPSIAELKNFLEWICKVCESINSNAELVSRLENPSPEEVEKISKFSSYLPYIGKLLDAVQIVKNKKRKETIERILRDRLEKTGHEFLIEEHRDLFDEMIKEIERAIILYFVLEIVYSVDLRVSSINPISKLRRSMGDRTPEEYFSNLVVGWFVEDVFYRVISNKNVTIEKCGVDAERKIVFGKVKKMGMPDFSLRVKDKLVYLELQRVGKRSIKISNDNLMIEVPEHKLSPDRKIVVIALWLGNNLGKIFRELENTVIFVQSDQYKTTKSSKGKKTYLQISVQEVRNLGIKWNELVSMNADEFLRHICKVLRCSTNYMLGF